MEQRSRAAEEFSRLAVEVFRLNAVLLESGDGLTRPVGLTSSRWQVLGVVDHAPASVAQVARDIGLTRQGVQRTANLLAEEGLIEYVENPDHRRSKLMKMTDKGREALEYIAKRQAEWANRISEGQSLEDLKVTAETLRSLRAKLSQSRIDWSDHEVESP